MYRYTVNKFVPGGRVVGNNLNEMPAEVNGLEQGDKRGAP